MPTPPRQFGGSPDEGNRLSELLQGSGLNTTKALKYLESLASRVDSIIVFGSAFLADGTPGPSMQARCDCERMIRLLLPRHRQTILTGRKRGVEKFLQANPGSNATEASLMKRYCGVDDASYIQEPLAIDTIGNLVFSTAWLFRLGLSRPLIISQATHLASRVRNIAEALVSREWDSGGVLASAGRRSRQGFAGRARGSRGVLP